MAPGLARAGVNKSSLALLSIEQLAPLLARKKVSPVEVLADVLARIELLNPTLNAYLTLLPDLARRRAAEAEREIMAGDYRGALHGVPVAVKDNIWTAAVRTTAGSRILADFIPPSDATVVHKLRLAGAVIVGKTNMSEFASGVTNSNRHFGRVRNPWDTERVPGGSSGGSAAAVAACMAFAALGTDTGGSVRIPAALCGIVGLKPTSGLVSCRGVVPLSATFDHVGPLARRVADAAMLLEAVAGYDPLDPMSVRQKMVKFPAVLRRRLRRPRLGWPKEFFFDRLDDKVKAAVEAAARTFEKLGGVIKPVSLAHVAEALELEMKMEYAEAAHFHEAAGFFPARAREYGRDVRERLAMGGRVLAVDYLRAQELRKVLRADFEAAFRAVDAILTPTVPVPAPLIGRPTVSINSHREPVRSSLIRMNPAANFTGLPAITVPCGFTPSGLPIGMQLIGPAFKEARLFRLAYLYEQATQWHLAPPPCGG
ncbi:MAG TPA: amidase [Candidatus Acidoferrales bacterium]|nr:amidase [Candidatus Acidoferrales bacterium]